ncbi:hypothetical protein SAMN05444008_101391 [Cnuella takakiae]|uniref:Uncharacterized protein n=1 Tax=Cnuella takakiae TaxID=1302690 RepID=A0A1M4TEA8_9BACT|nr:hypothetical protein [Cnuella takakiae]OLY90719.1 hypothetical protein BUE76_01505 [Cnuella takakiae]SHE42617.1 hypothetical protein SAMN05444008_101391 [Cnuella takakiae]
MTIHLIRTAGADTRIFDEVLHFLQSFEGPVQFTGNTALVWEKPRYTNKRVDEESFFHQERVLCSMACFDTPEIPVFRKECSWKELFEKCAQYRNTFPVAETDLVLLLTDIANEFNWFCALDPGFPYNGFVHTGEWAHYLKASEVFPVAYLVAGLILQQHMFENMAQLQAAVHQQPVGCINDFCGHKKEITLKMRTADVCPECMQKLQGKLEPRAIAQVLDIFEGVRKRLLFNQPFRQAVSPSRLVVNTAGRILLPDYGNLEIKLTPLEKTLYLFFLNHPEGVLLPDLVDHRAELRKLYGRFSNSGLLAEVHNGVEGLVDVTSNSASEKISRIKAAFTKALGADLAAQYIIKGEKAKPKSIALDRSLVIIQGNPVAYD